MSTTDPRIRDSLSEAAAKGSFGAGMQAAFWALVRVLCGAGIGTFAITQFDFMRTHEINGIFDDVTSRYDPLMVPVSIVFSLSIMVSIAAHMFNARAAARFGGAGGRLLGMSPWGLLGVFLAALVLAPGLTPPRTVGINQDPVFDDPEVWQQSEWAWYYAGKYLLVLALVLLLLGCVVALWRSAKAKRIEGMVERGVQVLGEVIQLRYHNVKVNDAPLVTISVRFTDQLGQERFLTKRRAIPEPLLPHMNQKVVVIYDPADPGNEKNMLLGLGDSSLEGLGAQHMRRTA